MKVEVSQGQILIESVDVEVRRRNLLVLVVNTHSKYPETSGIVDGDEATPPTIYLTAGEHSLKVDRDKNASHIMLPEFCKGWSALAEHLGRYSIKIVAWKPRRPEHYKEIWLSPDDHLGAGPAPGAVGPGDSSSETGQADSDQADHGDAAPGKGNERSDGEQHDGGKGEQGEHEGPPASVSPGEIPPDIQIIPADKTLTSSTLRRAGSPKGAMACFGCSIYGIDYVAFPDEMGDHLMQHLGGGVEVEAAAAGA